MKTLLSLAVGGLLLISLAACGGTKAATDQTPLPVKTLTNGTVVTAAPPSSNPAHVNGPTPTPTR